MAGADCVVLWRAIFHHLEGFFGFLGEILEASWAFLVTEAKKREDPKTNEQFKENHGFLPIGAVRGLLMEPSEAVWGASLSHVAAIWGRRGALFSSPGAILGRLGGM